MPVGALQDKKFNLAIQLTCTWTHDLSSCKAKLAVHSVWEKLTLCIPYTYQYKYLLYPRNVESF